MVQVRISRGGGTINITSAQEREARSLANVALQRGRLGVVTSGRDEAVRRRTSFLFSEIKRTELLTRQSSLRSAQIRAIERASEESIRQQSLPLSEIPRIPGLRDLTTSELLSIRTTEGIQGAIARQSLEPRQIETRTVREQLIEQLRTPQPEERPRRLIDRPIVTADVPLTEVPLRQTIGGQEVIFPGQQVDITGRTILTSPLALTQEVGDIARFGVGTTAQILGVPEITRTIEAQPIPQRVTETGQFIRPPADVTFVSPEIVGQAGGLAAEVGTLGALGAPIVGASFITSGVIRVTEPEATFQERFLGGAEIALGGAVLGARVLRPRITSEPPPRTEFRITEVQQPVIIDGQVIRPGRFGIEAVTPARRGRIENVLFGEDIIIAPSQRRFATGTVRSGEDEFILQFGTRREGATLTQAFVGSGNIQKIDLLKGIDQLTPVEARALLQGLGFGGIAKTTLDTQIARTGLTTQQLFRFSGQPGQRVIILPQPGTTTQRLAGIAGARPLATGSGGQLFQIATGVSEITRSVRGGRPLVVGGEAFIRRPVVVDSTRITLPPGRAPRPVTAPTTQQQQIQAAIELQQAQALAARVLRQQAAAATRVPSALRQQLRPPQFGFPTIVGGAGAQGLFTGQIQFEQTQETPGLLSINTRDTQIKRVTGFETKVLAPSVTGLETQVQAPELTQLEKQNIVQLSKNILELRQKQRQAEIMSSGFGQPQRTTQRERLDVIQQTLVTTLQTQKQIQEQVPVTEIGRPTITVPGTRIPRPGRPRVPPPPVVPPTGDVTLLRSALAKLKGQGVDVIVGTKSFKKTIAKNVPRFVGLEKGLANLEQTFASTLQLKPTGKKPKGTDKGSFSFDPRKFRPSKKDPLNIVERKEFRLDTKEESTKLQSIRKKKGGFKGRKKKGF